MWLLLYYTELFSFDIFHVCVNNILSIFSFMFHRMKSHIFLQFFHLNHYSFWHFKVFYFIFFFFFNTYISFDQKEEWMSLHFQIYIEKWWKAVFISIQFEVISELFYTCTHTHTHTHTHTRLSKSNSFFFSTGIITDTNIYHASKWSWSSVDHCY